MQYKDPEAHRAHSIWLRVIERVGDTLQKQVQAPHQRANSLAGLHHPLRFTREAKILSPEIRERLGRRLSNLCLHALVRSRGARSFACTRRSIAFRRGFRCILWCLYATCHDLAPLCWFNNLNPHNQPLALLAAASWHHPTASQRQGPHKLGSRCITLLTLPRQSWLAASPAVAVNCAGPPHCFPLPASDMQSGTSVPLSSESIASARPI
jgi:hypothetical protein